MNREVWTWTPMTIFHLAFSLWSWNTENLKTQPILYQKILACYREYSTSCKGRRHCIVCIFRSTHSISTSLLVSQWVTVMRRLWSDLGPIKILVYEGGREPRKAKGSLTSIFTANHLYGAALVPSVVFCPSAGPVFLLKRELSVFIQIVFPSEILFQLFARVLQKVGMQHFSDCASPKITSFKKLI